ncbi:MAG: NAD(P)-dependent oxidoreductase [Alphaproteobacteria bacterium]|nr:NAD(P)-dependent oxidoreductase [Alphaproteobacteria bacterium]MBV8407180.1 NAD(P)-dependent oxidoreductase [Alphaproteobacteria bacterium]
MQPPRVIALLGLGEAGSAIARGLCAENGWRGSPKPGDNAPRRLIAIDTALDKDARGTALGKAARSLDVAIDGTYTEALRDADLVLSAVPGEHALEAAQSAAPLLKKGACYLDLCTVTGRMADEDRDAIETAGGRYIDIAVMGGFFKSGIKAPMLAAGEGVEAVVAWMNQNGFDAKVLGPKPGSASSVKMLRSVIMKGLEDLAVESLVAAERQGILEEVLGCFGDADQLPFRDFISTLVRTHVVHAHRRWEEMGLVARTLEETGVEPLMTRTIEKAHRRTVEAAVAPADGQVPDLAAALALLSQKVVRGS